MFLYHAIKAGMDMGIVNAGALQPYDTVDVKLRDAIEDVVLNRRPDAADRLLTIAEEYRGTGEVADVAAEEWRRCRWASASRTPWSRASTRSSSRTPRSCGSRSRRPAVARSRSSRAR